MGLNQYIQSIEEETLSEYPLQIQSTGFDITSMMTDTQPNQNNEEKMILKYMYHKLLQICSRK